MTCYIPILVTIQFTIGYLRRVWQDDWQSWNTFCLSQLIRSFWETLSTWWKLGGHIRWRTWISSYRQYNLYRYLSNTPPQYPSETPDYEWYYPWYFSYRFYSFVLLIVFVKGLRFLAKLSPDNKSSARRRLDKFGSFLSACKPSPFKF